MAQFKPALAINPDILARYAANRLARRAAGKVFIAQRKLLDVALFLNGIPVATTELKTDFTQSITDAVDQYRFDRNPRPKGQAPEPLLSFPNGALVHFAVSNSEVKMVTKLAGPATDFLPFNQGDDGGAGNPVNPAGGHRTAYLWEKVWARESWLEILGRYLVAPATKRSRSSNRYFPPLPSARRDAQTPVRRACTTGRAASISSSTPPVRARPTPSPGRRTFSRSCTTRRQESLRHRARGIGSQRD